MRTTFFLVIVFISVALAATFGAPAASHGEDLPEPAHLEKGEYFVFIENSAGGAIYAIGRLGEFSRTDIGKTLAPVAKQNPSGFTASAWAPKGAVTATSVNAIHIKTGHNPDTNTGKIFTLLPVEFADFDPANYQSYFNQQASLFTDIKAGTGIFGGGFAPKVGDHVLLGPPPDATPERKSFFAGLAPIAVPMAPEGRSFYVWPPGLPPEPGDIFAIDVAPLPEPRIEWIEFDNRFGGFITMKTAGNPEPRVIGQVYQPVFGVGRFEGSVYCGPGRIRANHPGVVCVSTSPRGEIGGFQIIPLEHAMSTEMKFARVLTQWMVVGPVDPRQSQLWEGLAPLFSSNIYPSFIPVADDRFDAQSVFYERFQAVVKFKGDKEFRTMPVHTGRDDEALLSLETVRIYFPIEFRN